MKKIILTFLLHMIAMSASAKMECVEGEIATDPKWDSPSYVQEQARYQQENCKEWHNGKFTLDRVGKTNDLRHPGFTVYEYKCCYEDTATPPAPIEDWSPCEVLLSKRDYQNRELSIRALNECRARGGEYYGDALNGVRCCPAGYNPSNPNTSIPDIRKEMSPPLAPPQPEIPAPSYSTSACFLRIHNETVYDFDVRLNGKNIGIIYKGEVAEYDCGCDRAMLELFAKGSPTQTHSKAFYPNERRGNGFIYRVSQ